jgi:hypothetical protein
VFSTTCDSASITSIVSKLWHFRFNSGNKEKVVGGDGSHVVFGKKFPDEKEV